MFCTVLCISMNTGLLWYMSLTSQPQRHLESRLLVGAGSYRRLGGFWDRQDTPWLQHGQGHRRVQLLWVGTEFIRKLWCWNKSKLWSFLCRIFHCTPGYKHVTFSSGKLHIALGFVQHRRLDVIGLGFMTERADTWRQMLYSYREFLEILSYHIGLCDKTKKPLWSAIYVSQFSLKRACVSWKLRSKSL